mmetsp:Transcript_22893/g.40322  ORF Transcript_22893/g.40322 Transcript_22893/m.40322 type:complete len:211 (+) Transcript_22893:669-1301(+)
MAPAGIHVRKLLVEALHLRGAKRAIDADRERLGMLHAHVEGLDGLPGQRAATVVHNGGAQHHRQPLLLGLQKILVDRKDGRLAVLSVEDRLNHQHVNTTVHEAAHLLLVRIHQLIPCDVAERRVLHTRGNGESAARWPHGPCHKAGLVRLLLRHLRRCLLGKLCSALVHLMHHGLHLVFTLRDRGAVERVGLANVGACQEVLLVDVLDHL